MRISDWSSDVCSSDLLAETQARNGRLDIRAPAAGLVLTRDVEPGQIVSAGSGVLFRVALGGQMEMQAKLAESDLARLSVGVPATVRSEEHTSELQSLMRISYAVFCLKKKKNTKKIYRLTPIIQIENNREYKKQ